MAAGEMNIELHPRGCSCKGGSWVVFGEQSSSPCRGAEGGITGAIVISMTEWKTLGKPNSADDYRALTERAESGDRREFERYAVTLQVKLSRTPSWRNDRPQVEDTETEVIARGGALVRTHMAIDKGEMVVFEASGFRSQAEVMYVGPVTLPTGDMCLRVGLRFLDSPMPDSLIPPGAPVV
jgi:hypothetical protein